MAKHYYGNGKPVNVFRNQAKLAGYHTETKSGDSVSFDDTYNDIAEVELTGNTVQASDYYAKDGLSSQAGIPTPDAPIPVTSNLPSGTYKYTSTDGIYEFTISDDLRGIGTSLDKVVFDRKSHRGILERRNGKKVYDGTETFSNQSGSYDTTNRVLFSHILSIPLDMPSRKGVCTHFNSYSGSVQSISVDVTAFNFNSNVIYSDHIYFKIDKNLLSSQDATGFKSLLTTQYSAGTPVTVVYQLATPTRTPLTFTKVSSSSAPECPMTFLTNTPSLDYPAQVYDVNGNLKAHGDNIVDCSLTINHAVDYIKPGSIRKSKWATEIFNNNWVQSNLKPNTTYYFKYTATLESRSALIVYNDLVGMCLYSISRGIGVWFGYITNMHTVGDKILAAGIATTPKIISDMSIIAYTNRHSENGVVELDTVLFSDIIISRADVPYADFVASSCALPTLSKVGTVADEFVPKTGKKTKRVSDWANLDGSKMINANAIQNWLTGNRNMYSIVFPAPNTNSNNSIGFKYDSTPLAWSYSTENSGKTNTSDNRLYITANMYDTGWNPAINPSTIETKAYFYGWKMCNADGTAPYYKSEVPYTPSTWAEWTGTKNIVNPYNVIDNNTDTISLVMMCAIKPTTKYGFLVNVKTNTRSIISPIFAGNTDGRPFTSGISVPSNTAGNFKAVVTSIATITNNRVYQYFPAGSGKLEYGFIRIFELPVGSQIEADFTNLTADQLAAKYTFNGLCPKNWKHLVGNQSDIDASKTAVLPTASYAGYTPYKMLYQLATPVEESYTPTPVPTYLGQTIIETDSMVKPTINAVVKVPD